MSEKLKQKWGIWTLPLVAIVLVGVLGFIVLATIAMALVGTYFSSDTNYELEGEEARDFIAERFFSLPEDAVEVYLYYFSIQDFEAYIRFSSSPEALESWLENEDLCYTSLVSTSSIYNTRGEILAWWQPSAIPMNDLGVECDSSPDYQLAIDQSNPDLWIVYLVVMR
jgi:hypothetical protein